jgi:hypothetical protein
MNYEDMTHQTIERYTSKVLQEIHKGISDSGLKLLQLTQMIPNWETYLTPKQLEVIQCYIKCLNASEVDYQLKLNSGTTQQRLFGSSTSKGALGRLEEIVKIFEKQGYFEKQKKVIKNQSQRKQIISDKTKEGIRELLKIINDMPEYEQYLTESQKTKLFEFLRLKSIKVCAKHFGIEETTFRQSLLGRNKNDGILGKLRKAYYDKTVNNWDEI